MRSALTYSENVGEVVVYCIMVLFSLHLHARSYILLSV